MSLCSLDSNSSIALVKSPPASPKFEDLSQFQNGLSVFGSTNIISIGLDLQDETGRSQKLSHNNKLKITVEAHP